MTEALNDFAHADPGYEANTVKGISVPRYVPPVHPDPVQRAVEISVDDRALPKNAAKIARKGIAAGWKVRITAAIGYGYDGKTGEAKSKDVMEPTGEETPTGRAAMKKVGTTMAPPVHSFRVILLAPSGMMFVGHWAPGWDCGLVLRGRTVLANVNWSGLEKAVTDAQSGTHLREQDQQPGWHEDQLPL